MPGGDRTAALPWGLGVVGWSLSAFLAPATPEMRWRLGFSYDPASLTALLGGDRPPMGSEDVQKYGLGWPLLMRMAVSVFGPDPDLPLALNPVLHGLAVVAAAQLARALGASPAATAWVAFAYATSPLLVWFGHTDGPFPADALFGLLTLGAAARYARGHRRRDLVMAVAAMVVTAQFRVESVTTGAFALLLVLAFAGRFPWRSPAPYLAALAMSALLLPHAVSVHAQVVQEWTGRLSTDEPTRQLGNASRWLFTNGTMQAWIWIAAWPLGVACGGIGWRLRLWALVSMLVAASTVPDVLPLETAFSVARYQLRALPFAALLGGLGAAWASTGRGGRLGAAVVVAGAALGLQHARTISVLKTEYDVFDAHLAEVPRGCTVMTWRSQPDTTLFVPLHLSRLRGLGHTWRDLVRDEVPATGCVWYYRSGGFSQHDRAGDAGDQHPVCAAFEGAWPMRPVVQVELEADPFGPMGIENQRPGTPIPVGFFEIRPGP